MELTTTQRIRMYIEDEERDAIIYKQLSNIAQSTKSREILFEISNDEQSHSDSFKKLYYSITGRSYKPLVIPPELNGTFKDVILNQILEETDTSRKYEEQYYIAQNKTLKNIYLKAKIDEQVHTNKLIYILLYELIQK